MRRAHIIIVVQARVRLGVVVVPPDLLRYRIVVRRPFTLGAELRVLNVCRPAVL